MYLLSNSCRLPLAQATRLKLSSQEVRELEKAPDAPPKFPTECFLLTAHCSHVCWTSIIRRHRSIMREIRYFQSIVATMQAEGATEPVRGWACDLSVGLK